MAATNTQVQHYVDERVRPHCERIRDLIAALTDDEAVIGDVYDNLNNSPTWTDGRADGPPHLLLASDVLAYNTFAYQLLQLVNGTAGDAAAAMSAMHAQLPIILKACVRAAG